MLIKLAFRKPTSPPLPLREGPPLISVFFNSLYDPFGSPCRGQKPQGRRGNRPTRCHFFESLRLPFQRELHLFPQAPSSSEGGGCNRSSSELKPLRYKVGGPSEVCARFLCGMNRMGALLAYIFLCKIVDNYSTISKSSLWTPRMATARPPKSKTS